MRSDEDCDWEVLQQLQRPARRDQLPSDGLDHARNQASRALQDQGLPALPRSREALVALLYARLAAGLSPQLNEDQLAANSPGILLKLVCQYVQGAIRLIEKVRPGLPEHLDFQSSWYRPVDQASPLDPSLRRGHWHYCLLIDSRHRVKYHGRCDVSWRAAALPVFEEG